MGVICRMCRALVDSVGSGKGAVEAQGVYHTCYNPQGSAAQVAATQDAADHIIEKHGSMFEERS